MPGSGTVDSDDGWVELRNASSTAIDLTSGYRLLRGNLPTFDLAFADLAPGQFFFSNGGSLSSFQPGEYLVVGELAFASGRLQVRNPDDFAVQEIEASGLLVAGKSLARVPDTTGLFLVTEPTIAQTNPFPPSPPEPIPALPGVARLGLFGALAAAAAWWVRCWRSGGGA